MGEEGDAEEGETAALAAKEARMKAFEEEGGDGPALRELCACNGISKTDFVKQEKEYERLEVFQTFRVTFGDHMRHFLEL